MSDDEYKVTADHNTITYNYYVTKTSRWTFEDNKIRGWLNQHLSGRVLNACAGETKLNYSGEIIRNDLNPERDADTHVDVAEISNEFGENSFDTILYDPPFSQSQAEDKYDGISVQDNSQAKREFDTILRPGGSVVQFGYTTTCMPGELGYTRDAVAIFNTLGPRNDILGTVDRRMNGSLADYE